MPTEELNESGIWELNNFDVWNSYLEGGSKAAVFIMREYTIFNLPTNQLPVSFLDVIKIISNSTWYTSHLERSCTFCHIIMYTMLQNSMNTWLYDLRNPWKMKSNIKKERDVVIQQQGKGLVWLNFQKRAMHNMQHIVQNAMLNVHGEYISCRDPKEMQKKSMISKPIQCNAFITFYL